MTHLDEKALEAAKNAFALEGGHDATRWLEAAIRAYLSAVPSSPVSELVGRLRDVAGPVRMNNGSFSDIAHEAATALTTLSTRNAELERGIDRLAAYIMENVPGEPSENQGAVDTAIRLLGKNAELEREVKRLREALSGCFCPRPVNAREYGFTVGECVAAGECGCCDGETLRALSTSPQGGEHGE